MQSNHATLRTSSANNGFWQPVDDVTHIKDHLNDGEEGVVKQLSNGVEVWIVEVNATQSTFWNLKTTFDNNHLRNVIDDEFKRRAV